MTKEELLKIFNLDELYENDTDKIPFIYHYSNLFLNDEVNIIFYFYKEEINLAITWETLIEAKKTIYLTFKIEDNNVYLIKDIHHKNEIFPHLTLDKNIEIDLDFLSGMIYNFFIPKYKLKFNFCENDYC